MNKQRKSTLAQVLQSTMQCGAIIFADNFRADNFRANHTIADNLKTICLLVLIFVWHRDQQKSQSG